MNILLYVTTVLMLLSVLTYARLENFKAVMGMQTGFVHYMSSIEHQSITQSAEMWYEKLTPSSKSVNKVQPEKNPAACSRISFHLLLNADDRNKHAVEYRETRELIKQLMADLFMKAQFYKEINAKRPGFRDDILDEIQRAAEALPKGKTITNTGDLLSLEFQNQDLHLAFYEMMNGMPKESLKEVDTVVAAAASKTSMIISNSEEDTDDPNVNEADENHAPPGNVSLLDFITLRPTYKLRIYLASQLMLMTIYRDSLVVDQIIEKRMELYQRLKNGQKEVSSVQLSKEFEANYKQMGQAGEYGHILDFNVSKTNPNKYK